jgi:formamidopyrimidine-DNA glycosylase
VPELPEVEVLIRFLDPLLRNKIVRNVDVRRARIIAPTSIRILKTALRGAEFIGLTRRAKFLLFTFKSAQKTEPLKLLGHLGMTGRMYLQPVHDSLPKHAAVVLNLGDENFVFEDTRYFGRFTFDTRVLENLGPEPLGDEFSTEYFAHALSKSNQPIKVKLLDQSLVAGIGNIYATEALFHAGISPKISARRLKLAQIGRLRLSIRDVLEEAIKSGSTVRLDYAGSEARNRLFYFGSADASNSYEERFRAYDREGHSCHVCGTPIRRITQAARSTFYCPKCQKSGRSVSKQAKSV